MSDRQTIRQFITGIGEQRHLARIPIPRHLAPPCDWCGSNGCVACLARSIALEKELCAEYARQFVSSPMPLFVKPISLLDSPEAQAQLSQIVRDALP